MTWLDRLKAESHDLSEKIVKLNAFIGSEPFFALESETDRQLLSDQYAFMNNYLVVLRKRIARAERLIARSEQRL